MLNSEYQKLYEKLISAKVKVHIINYSCYKRNFTYKPFSHQAKNSALDDLYDLIIDNTVFYAFSEDEILLLNANIGILNDLRVAAKYAFAEQLPKRSNANSDGTLGEVLLDMLIQAYEPNAEKLIARAKYTEMNKKSEITGYDALYFTKNNDEITLWLGQAKSGKDSYCKSDMKNDLNTKFTSMYFANTAFYIASRTTSDELLSIVNEINKACLLTQKESWTKEKKIERLYSILRSHNVVVKMPCLLAYTDDIYTNPDLLKEKIDSCIARMSAYFDLDKYSIEISLPYEIVFYVFPIKDVSHIRERIINFKREVY